MNTNHAILPAVLAAGLLLSAPALGQDGGNEHRPITADDIQGFVHVQAQNIVNTRGVPPGYYLLDGDMQMPLSFNPDTDGFFNTNVWPGGVVPYTFDASVSAADRTSIQTAMAAWSAVAGVTFVVRGTQTDYAYIQISTGNNSAVGHQGGQQIINYAAGQTQGVYIHELGHCLGLLHEQQRSDRLVTVQPCNVQGVTCNAQGQVVSTGSIYNVNFPVIGSGTQWAWYDFASVMHYSRCAFSIGCPAGSTCNCSASQETMTVVQPYHDQWNSVIGTANSVSFMDGITMRGLYPFSGDRWVDPTWFGSPQGTFLAPYGPISFVGVLASTPANGTVFFKTGVTYPAIGTYSQPVTLVAPNQDVLLH